MAAVAVPGPPPSYIPLPPHPNPAPLLPNPNSWPSQWAPGPTFPPVNGWSALTMVGALGTPQARRDAARTTAACQRSQRRRFSVVHWRFPSSGTPVAPDVARQRPGGLRPESPPPVEHERSPAVRSESASPPPPTIEETRARKAAHQRASHSREKLRYLEMI
ncbi:hypothetical protein DFJ74DRAFT_132454 [Hyaloraphidium curvatum]|nr:hypothetical protein DFJ74DRAFT_132454 [Hyaloraphidium curvatum]